MAVSAQITNVLNRTIQAVQSVIPLAIKVGKPSLFTQPFQQESIGVLIGMTGDIRGRLIMRGDPTYFSIIGESMFGMALQGELLESFSSELGNMIAGNLATQLASDQLTIDITPPTMLIGQTKMAGFTKAINLPIYIKEGKGIHFILSIE